MLSVPLINPLRYVLQGASSVYNTKFFDEVLFPKTILPFEQPVDYYQPFNLSDPLVQYIITLDALTTPTVNFHRVSDDSIIYSQAMTHQFNYSVPGGILYSVYTINTDLNNLGEGIFYARITDGTTTIESNKFCVEDNHENTILVKYRSTKLYQEVIFEKLILLDSSFYFYLRVQGYIRHNLPERSSTTYEDQVLDMTALKNVPYNSWSFITDSAGIPTYMIDLLNRVTGCSNTFFDGRQFTIPQDAKWEEKEEEFYPLRGWGIDLREARLLTSIGFDGSTGGDSGDVLPIAHKIDSDWWNTTSGQYILPLTSVGQKEGYTVSQIYIPKLVFRSGNPIRITTGTPSNDQVKFDNAVGLIFDSSLTFNPGETVTVLFEVV